MRKSYIFSIVFIALLLIIILVLALFGDKLNPNHNDTKEGVQIALYD